MIINPGFSAEKEAEGGVGRSMAGQTVEPAQGNTVTAAEGAEVFNDYRARTFDNTGRLNTGNVASGSYSHVEGTRSTATGDSAHAEGANTNSSGVTAHAEGHTTVASGNQAHAEGYLTVASGAGSHAEGYSSKAAGSHAHAEGGATIAPAQYAHTEGSSTLAASKYASHAEGASSIVANGDQILRISSYDAATRTFTFDQSFGDFSDAFSHIAVGVQLFVVNSYYIGSASLFTVSAVDSTNKKVTVSETVPTSNFTPTFVVNVSYTPTTGYCAHAEGDRTVAMGNYGSHAEGRQTIASGSYGSHAEGRVTSASGNQAHAEGYNTAASNTSAHAEGSSTKASDLYSHAEGYQTEASGEAAHAEGRSAVASGTNSHAEGCGTIASGSYSHAEGRWTIASSFESHASGYRTIANTTYQFVIGRYNTDNELGYGQCGFVMGKGTESGRANAFRVADTGVYAAGNYASSGADYAELFEWADSNPDKEDRAGRFVTLDGEKIRLASPEDGYILGIVSGNPSVVGDVHDDQWAGMYLYDIYGRPLWEDVEVPAETVEEPDPDDPEKTVTRVLIPAHTERRQKLNPDYDSTQPYQPRTQRPEWDAVGMLGKLVALDDGTCQVNGWCTVGEGGIAVHSAQPTRFRVMARLDEAHIRVLIL